MANNRDPCVVIVRHNNTQIEVWVSRYLAWHVNLMWIKGYMVELSKYNQCNVIHSCPAEQMFEQMSGKKKCAGELVHYFKLVHLREGSIFINPI